MANELRVANNKVSITGVLKEHKLKEGKSDNGKYINGSLVIKAGEFTELDVKVFVSELTKEKKEKKAYRVLKDIIDDKYPTMAKDKENATVLSLYGSNDFSPQLREERYANQTKTDVVAKVGVDLGFGNINVNNDLTEEDFKATFDIEMFVTEIIEEEKEEEETGRVKVKGYVPTFGGGIFPMEVMVGKIVSDGEEYDFAEDIRDNVNEGDTINLWGDINFGKIIEQKSKGGKLGKAKVEDTVTYIHEFVGVGADILEDDKAYEEEEVEKAVKERKIALEEILSKAKTEDGDKSKGKGLSGKSKSSNEDKTKKRNINF